MQQVLTTHRPWFVRLADAVADRWRDRRRATLVDLDPRTLSDIGVHPSECSSIAAEASSRARLTRLRIALSCRHG